MVRAYILRSSLAMLSFCGLVMFAMFLRQHSGGVSCKPGLASDEHSVRRRDLHFQEKAGSEGNFSDIPFHPFENTCKFIINNIYSSDIMRFRITERLRRLQCPYENFDFATMDSEGYMYVHPHFTQYPKWREDVQCEVAFIEGGLRNSTNNRGKDDFREVAVVEAPVNVRFFANGDAYFIRCYAKGEKVFEQIYPGMRDLDKEINQVYVVEDMESFDNFGRRREKTTIASDDRYSIDILAFDSTSRTMFMRHLPRTVETMNKLGYEILYGYNKVGDNSAVNLEPILAGDLPEALSEPKLDISGDINADWILPTTRKLDPTALPFLWKMMKKEYGCRSMFNEDISVKHLGLFHYPVREFLPGFTELPADHFYRAYYLAVYKNWTYSACKDGDQIQRQYVDLWRRFANKYKDICHFGFTFTTTLTHEAGFLLELLDEQLSSSLQNLYFTGALDKGISIIMGDHGNRIGLIQFSYTGRIEERMPLMAIRLPSEFKKLHPEEYSNFLSNKWKLTSNFDIHQTLKDIALMSFGSARKSSTKDYGRGISLFDKIPSTRSCFDAYIPENFCTCLVDRSNLSVIATGSAEDKENIEQKYRLAIEDWIEKNGIECVNASQIESVENVAVLGLNAFARHGLRTKRNATRVEQAKTSKPKMDYLYHEVIVMVRLAEAQRQTRLLFRIEENTMDTDLPFLVVLEPLVQDPPSACPFKSIFSVCSCLSQQLNNGR